MRDSLFEHDPADPPRRPGTDLLSIVIPVFNESGAIEPLLREIAETMSDCDHEILVVDDGSRDDTGNILKHLVHDQFPHLRVLLHDKNYGQSAAIDTGIRAAAGCWVATLDGDGQNEPADIHRLLRVRDGTEIVHLVCGLRRNRRDSFLKRLSSRLANAVRAWMLADATPDTGCGLKLIHRQTYLSLPRFNHMHRFLPALILRSGGRVVSAEVGHRERRSGVSKYGIQNRLWVGIVDLFGVAWLQRRSLRAKFEEVESNDV